MSVLRRVADSLLALPYRAWHFGDSVAFEGMLAAGDALEDPQYAAFAHGFARGWLAKAHDGFEPLDCTAAGAAMCLLAERKRDGLLRDGLVRLADYLTTRPKLEGIYQTWAHAPLGMPHGGGGMSEGELRLLDAPGPGAFVDCLHFDPPFFARLSRLTDDTRWEVEAVEQALAYVEALQDPATGLFHHFVLERTGRRYIPRWGRGQGWALLGLLEVVEALDETPSCSRDTSSLRGSIRAVIGAMLETQRPDGHWDAVVGVPGSGLESSTAAFMAKGFRQAHRLGIDRTPRTAAAAERAAGAVLSLVDEHGHLGEVSVDVRACTSESHYVHVPRGAFVPWGQGPVALMLGERSCAQTPERLFS